MKANNSEIKKLDKSLKAARTLANTFEFGTYEFEQAMTIVRSLTDKIDNLTDFGPYTSIDGNVFQS